MSTTTTTHAKQRKKHSLDDTVSSQVSVLSIEEAEHGLAQNNRRKDEKSQIRKAFPMRQVSWKGCGDLPVQFNPFSSLIAIALLWGVSIWCMVVPDKAMASLLTLQAKTAQYFTWFYVGTRPLFLFFCLFLTVKYGHIKLGPKDSVPAYGDLSYFVMIFSAGICSAIFYYGVSEPLWHEHSNWFANEGHSQDAVDHFAIAITYVHWGATGWAGYMLVAVATGLATHRYNLPLTFRSCFFPILGEYTWGWMGDVIDGFTIVVTIAGLCTSLGLGAFQAVGGIQRVFQTHMTHEDKESMQVALVWLITMVATGSVVSGVDKGIKYLSFAGFGLGTVLLFSVLCLENTAYLLNLQVQSVGYYFQVSLFQLNFWADTFGQLQPGQGRAVDGKSAETWWMDTWTVFYMAWWSAWSGFVGVFIARISRGRTINELFLYSLVVPLFYIFLWFGTWGGIGIRQHRQAMELAALGEEYYGDPGYFLVEDSLTCFNVPQEELIANNTVVFKNQLPGVTPVCMFDAENSDAAFFNVLYSFSFPEDFSAGYGNALSGLSIIAAILYFINSSDCASLIVSYLSANGEIRHHWLLRAFWSFTQGALACALLKAGGNQALSALQAASIIAGLPFTVFMVYLLQSILLMCQRAATCNSEQFAPDKRDFNTPVYGGIFNAIEYLVSLGNVNQERVKLGMGWPTSVHFKEFIIAAFFPFVPLSNVLKAMKPQRDAGQCLSMTSMLYTVFFVLWVGLFASVPASPSLKVFGFVALLMCGLMLSDIKSNFRMLHNIRGNLLGDIITSTFLYPQVLLQLGEEIRFINEGSRNSCHDKDTDDSIA